MLLPDIDLTWAPGSEAALNILEQQSSIDAIVLDLCLPTYLAKSEEEEGLELLTRLKNELARDIPVLVLSNFSRDEAEDECLSRKASVYLQKPCPIKELLKHLTSLTSTNHG